MKQNRTLSSESLRIKVKNGKVIITFDAQDWSFVYAKLLTAMAQHAEDRGIPVAGHIGDALKLKMKELSPSQESYEEFLQLCERLAQSEQNSPDDIDPNFAEPN